MSHTSLFINSNEAEWTKALDSYKEAITIVGKSKKKDIKLQELDEWYKKSEKSSDVFTITLLWKVSE